MLLPLALFTVVVFPYLRDKGPGKSFDNGLWKFNFTGRFIGLIFRQRHFPFPKRRTRPAGGKNRERIQPNPGHCWRNLQISPGFFALRRLLIC